MNRETHLLCGLSVDSNGRLNSGTKNTDSVPAMKDGVCLTDTDMSTDSKGKRRIGGYVLGRTIGEGSFAKVKEGVHILTNERVAIKVVDKMVLKSSEYLQRNFRREAVVLQKIGHPNVVKLLEVLETENHYYLVLELATGGELMNHICAVNKLAEEEARKFLRQIVSAVDYLHKAGVIHRDLKVENLLLDDQQNIKIIDFGLSNTFGEGDRLLTQCGSPAYAAPEVFCQKAYGPAVDVWSIGINMYAMLTGELPFHVEPINMTVLHAQILLGAKIPDTLSESCQDLLRQLLQQKEEKRIKMEDIMKHPWMNEGYPSPLEPAPFPAFKTVDQLNCHILKRMVDNLGYDKETVVHNVCENKASPDTATYHLMDTMLKNIARRHRLSGGLRTCFSDGHIDVQMMAKPARHTKSTSLPTKPSSEFKDAAQALNSKQPQPLTQPQKQPATISSEAVPVTQLSTDGKFQSHADEQLNHAAEARVEFRPRRGSTSTLADGCRRFSRRPGLKLTVANPVKSNRTQTKSSTVPKWALGSRLDQSPASMRSTRILQMKRTTSDQTPPTTEPGTEIYSLTGNMAPLTREDPQKLPSISGSSLVGTTSIRTSRVPRSPRSPRSSARFTHHQMKS